ncbi:hypothetical protein HPB50_025825 [Hyalomma asiaticum]|uniref:Uncharacterized protein n=1 Tax=Hyalomma asiaticum TaxID=266040 RepID=A0ACB7SX09_HYAAI|nr:hypothetical protein HPB50_025825 [Hyalomma asiaticum]
MYRPCNIGSVTSGLRRFGSSLTYEDITYEHTVSRSLHLVTIKMRPLRYGIEPSESMVYPKDSYMWYRTERKPGRQGFQGNYRRSYHGSGGGEAADSGPDSCPGSDQGSEFTSEEASSESSSSSCPSSPLTFPPHTWPSPGAPAPQSATTAPSQDSSSAKAQCDPADSLNNNSSSSSSTSATITTTTTTSTGTATVGGNINNVNNNNNALSPTTGGEQVACNGCHEHWTSASLSSNATGTPSDGSAACRRTNSATQTGPDD